ncbi:bifunctional methylenetetrahydrofolate dehydrogenase/methenyltetrahydrofolate cyclohydrolase FolD [soil metagenome]
MELMESKQLVASLHLAAKKEAARLVDAGFAPHLAVVLIGEDEASLRYIDIKSKRGKEDGVTVSVYYIEADAPKSEAQQMVDYLAGDTDVHGIIVQLPLPGSWSKAETADLIAKIPNHKDVDGLNGAWMEQSYQGTGLKSLNLPFTSYLPPMVASVCLLLEAYQLPLEGKNIVVVGRGKLVGAPLTHFFEKQGLNVTAVDEHTDDIFSITSKADILIAGTGVENLITYQWVKEGATVMDCANDVHRDSVDQVARFVAPARGGLGPVTVAWLLRNVVAAAAQQFRERGGQD